MPSTSYAVCCRPGGTAFFTVPVGRPERFEWVRTLSL